MQRAQTVLRRMKVTFTYRSVHGSGERTGRSYEQHNHEPHFDFASLICCSEKFLGDYIYGMCDMHNCVACPRCRKTPDYLLKIVKPNVGHLQIFGSKV